MIGEDLRICFHSLLISSTVILPPYLYNHSEIEFFFIHTNSNIWLFLHADTGDTGIADAAMCSL